MGEELEATLRVAERNACNQPDQPVECLTHLPTVPPLPYMDERAVESAGTEDDVGPFIGLRCQFVDLLEWR